MPTELEQVLAAVNGVNAKLDTQAQEIAALKSKVNEPQLPPAQPVTIPEGAIKAAGITVTTDEGDQPFKSLGEQMQAVRRASTTGRIDPRLLGIKARAEKEMKAIQGNSETALEDGGYLLQPTFTNVITGPLFTTDAVFTSRVSKLPIGNNSFSGHVPGVNETSRATGSRFGGIQGYRIAEGGEKTITKPTFNQLAWQLKAYAVACAATDELLQDAAMLEQYIRMGAADELIFMVNDDILNQSNNQIGAKGVLSSNGLVSVPKETGQAADTIVFDNLTKMWARMPPRSKANANWYINPNCMPQLAKLALAVGTGGIPAPFIDKGTDGTVRIYGRPVIETEYNPTLGDLGDILLADFSHYLFWERAMQAASSIHVYFLTDQTTFRFVYRCDGKPSRDFKVTPKNGSDEVSPFVALAARA